MRCIFSETKRTTVLVRRAEVREYESPALFQSYQVVPTEMNLLIVTQVYFDGEFSESRASILPVMVLHHRVSVLGEYKTFTLEQLVDQLIDPAHLVQPLTLPPLDLVQFCHSESEAIRAAISSADTHYAHALMLIELANNASDDRHINVAIVRHTNRRY